jgi:hypothetical protein
VACEAENKRLAHSHFLTGPLIADALSPKPYLSIRELAAVTPWTEQAIRTMMAKGVFSHGKHFFYVGRRPIYKWAAIVLFIEQREEHPEPRIPLRRGGFVGGAETQ